MKSLSIIFLLVVSVSISKAADDSKQFGIELPIVANAGTGPVMDVVIDGKFAYAIGRGSLHVLDISAPQEPRILGKLSGLVECSPKKPEKQNE